MLDLFVLAYRFFDVLHRIVCGVKTDEQTLAQLASAQILTGTSTSVGEVRFKMSLQN